MKPFIYKIGQVVNDVEITDLQRKPIGNTNRVLKVCFYRCAKCLLLVVRDIYIKGTHLQKNHQKRLSERTSRTDDAIV